MTPNDIFSYAGTAASVVAALVLVKAAWQTQTSKVWREEAEAQRTRADRLQADMEEIKARLTRIETENQRLVQLLMALDPERVTSHRI
ncbi:hypothetical protein [Streptomyces halobius]|uniref:Uncharacterized protein n=1 Tax=Streptomyces halobius TaxID=2879846 RepID=A0ABY4M326_9ACTN|nr:hypothetical protein [Streptomyces halobius]UQA92166.1 hypothetical protein K9S39_10245 [Streptomyces halobius]